MEVSPVGTDAWRKDSYNTIKVACDLLHKPSLVVTGLRPVSTKQNSAQTKTTRKDLVTPPPFYRDLVVDGCNTFARDYMRDAQNSVYILRHALIETNRQIHRLQQDRDMLEKSHANIRRDMVTNQETTQLRNIRPKSERRPDKVDPLLQVEKKGLASLKNKSELQLKEVARQMKVMQNYRKALTDLCKERSRVLGILSDPARPHLKTQHSTIAKSEKAECKAMARNALVTCERFRNIHPNDWLNPVDSSQLQDNITKGLLKKGEETDEILDDLTLILGSVRNFVQREKNQLYETEMSNQMHLGPKSSLDLSVRERLDRPLVRALQRHPGTQIPDGILILQGADDLQESLTRAREKVGRLQDTRLKLLEDVQSKRWGARLDRAAFRLRERSVKGQRERLLL